MSHSSYDVHRLHNKSHIAWQDHHINSLPHYSLVQVQQGQLVHHLRERLTASPSAPTTKMACLINCSFEIKRSPSASSGSLIDTGLKWALLLGLGTATVFIGGLGALQNECLGDDVDLNTNGLDGIWGFSPQALSGKKLFRCKSTTGPLRKLNPVLRLLSSQSRANLQV